MKDPLLFGIVIPYFQRERGILRRTIKSILEQQGVSHFMIMIVDDASPVPATEELADLLVSEPRLHILRQANAGPGAARNAGLDALPADTTYVAFVDSDDSWHPQFLAQAQAALDAGHDVFFANSQRSGFEHSRFQWQSEEQLNLDEQAHRAIDAHRSLYAFEGDFFDYAIHRSNIISTSALVYRRASNPDLRFNTHLFNGQDRLFKLSLCQTVQNIAFCPTVLVEEGRGINIFDNSQWGSPQALVLLPNYIKLSKYILKHLSLNKAQRKYVNRQLNDSRYAMLASCLHLLKAGKPIEWSRLWDTLRADPAFALHVLPNFLRLLATKGRAAAHGH
nr:glycosyltransferase family 2 protein [Aestuariicella hydrocarbonica]